MIEKFKTGFKLIPFGIRMKQQVAFGVVFLVIGVLLMAFANKQLYTLGGMYIVISGMFSYQLLISLDISTLVQSSPYKKMLQTSIPIIVYTPIMLIAHTVVVVCWMLKVEEMGMQDTKNAIVMLTLIIFFMEVYMGLVYKYFWPSVIIFCIFVGGGFGAISSILYMTGTALLEQMSLPLLIVLSYGVILLGDIIAYGLSLLLYKKEISKQAFGAMLKKAYK